MKPIFITINDKLHLKVIPDSQFHIDGHPVLTHNYNVYLNEHNDDIDTLLGSDVSSDKLTDEDYYGAIAFERPAGNLFSYTPGTHRQLTRDEVEQIIVLLNHHRDNPANWNIDN